MTKNPFRLQKPTEIHMCCVSQRNTDGCDRIAIISPTSGDVVGYVLPEHQSRVPIRYGLRADDGGVQERRRREEFFKRPVTVSHGVTDRSAGVKSAVSYTSRAFLAAMRNVFGCDADERIAELHIGADLITAKFERLPGLKESEGEDVRRKNG